MATVRRRGGIIMVVIVVMMACVTFPSLSKGSSQKPKATKFIKAALRRAPSSEAPALELGHLLSAVNFSHSSWMGISTGAAIAISIMAVFVCHPLAESRSFFSKELEAAKSRIQDLQFEKQQCLHEQQLVNYKHCHRIEDLEGKLSGKENELAKANSHIERLNTLLDPHMPNELEHAKRQAAAYASELAKLQAWVDDQELREANMEFIISDRVRREYEQEMQRARNNAKEELRQSTADGAADLCEQVEEPKATGSPQETDDASTERSLSCFDTQDDVELLDLSDQEPDQDEAAMVSPAPEQTEEASTKQASDGFETPGKDLLPMLTMPSASCQPPELSPRCYSCPELSPRYAEFRQ